MYLKKDSSFMKHLDFLVLDILALEFSFWLAYLICGRAGNAYMEQQYLLIGGILLLIQILVGFFCQNYKDILRRGYLVELKNVFAQNTAVMAAMFTFMFVTKLQFVYSRSVFMQMWLYGIFMTYGERLIRKYIVRNRLRSSENRIQLLVVCSYQLTNSCIRKLQENKYQSYKIAGIVIFDRQMRGSVIGGVPVVADRNGIFEYTRKHVIDEVFIDIRECDEVKKNLTEHFLEMGVPVHLNHNWNQTELPNAYVESLGSCSVLTTSIKTASPYELFLKRLMDITGGLAGVLLTVILYIIFAPIIFIQSPGPVFFSQERVGKNGRKFRMYKFRSMYMDAEERKKELMEQNKMSGLMFKIDNDPRIIPIGRFIRKYSIDEFPQFWNVLKGDMSLVGTRPPTVDEFEQYDPHHKVRLSIKPGITGLWQVSGRSDITDFEEVVRLDHQYIREWNLGLDVKIIWKTVRNVVVSKGAV